MYPFNPEEIFEIENESQFNDFALKIFNYQAENNPVYKEFLYHLGVNISSVDNYKNIPFLPIEFFKSHKVISGNQDDKKIFHSSGTTGTTRSKHYLKDIKLYENSFMNTFSRFYGDIKNYCVLALLP
ncbi:MAG: acyltransferase, partial [Bacteroidales bacterium]